MPNAWQSPGGQHCCASCAADTAPFRLNSRQRRRRAGLEIGSSEETSERATVRCMCRGSQKEPDCCHSPCSNSEQIIFRVSRPSAAGCGSGGRACPGPPLRRRLRRRRRRRMRQRGAGLPRRVAAPEQVAQEGSSPGRGGGVNRSKKISNDGTSRKKIELKHHQHTVTLQTDSHPHDAKTQNL